MSDIDFKKMKVAELKAELNARSIDIPRGAKKAELLAMLMSSVEAEGGAGGDAEQDPEKVNDPEPLQEDQQSLPVEEENESPNEAATEESTSVSNEVVQSDHENYSEEKIPQTADETSSNTDEVASTVAEAGSTVAEASSPSPDQSFADEKMEEENVEEPAVVEEANDCHDEAQENNEMADDIVELEEPGMQDLVDESDNKVEEVKEESMDKTGNNEGDAATDMQQEEKHDNDAADEAMSIEASGLDTSLSKDECEEKQTPAAPKTSEETRSSKSSERSSRHSDRRGGDHHSDRKRRHDDSRSRRDDERFAPPPEEPEEEFDDTLVVMDKYNSSLNMKLHQNRVTLQTLTLESFAFLWASARATYGVKTGKVHFECKISEEHSVRHMPHSTQHRHPVRVGWSDSNTSILIGESEMSFALCSTGKAVTDETSKDFGSGYKEGDVVGCYLDLTNEETVTVTYTKNGESLGAAFTEEKSKFEGKTMFPHISCRNVTVEFNFGQKEEPYFPHPEELNDYQFIGSIPVEERVRGLVGPTAKKDCDVLMLCGLPGCGKSYYASKLCEENPEKFYNVLGAKSIMSNMTVTGLPGMKRDVKLSHANNCLTRIFQIACRKKRHYIIDQTNVFASARRKMRSFEGFNRKAIVIVPTDEDYKSRADKRTKDEGKDIPDYAVIDMKANFSFPEKGDLFEEVEFLELNQADAEKQVSKYREEARKRGPPQEKRFRSNGGSSGPFGGFSGQRSVGRWGGSMGGGNNFDFPKGGSGMGGRMSGGFRGGQQRGGFGNGGNMGNRYMGSNGGGRSNGSRGGGGYGDGRRNSGSFNRGNNYQQGSGGNRSFSGGSSAGGRGAGYGGNRNGPAASHRSNNSRQSGGGYNQSRQNNSSMSGSRNHSRSRSSSQTAPHRSSFNQNNQQQAAVTNRTSFDYHRAYQQQTAQIAAAAAAQQQQQQQQQAAVAAAAVAAVPQQAAAPQAAAAAQTQPQAYSQAYTAQGQNDYSQQWAQYYQHQAAVQQQQQQQAAAVAAAAQYQSYYAYQQAFSGQK